MSYLLIVFRRKVWKCIVVEMREAPCHENGYSIHLGAGICPRFCAVVNFLQRASITKIDLGNFPRTGPRTRIFLPICEQVMIFHCSLFVQAGMLLSEYFYDTERLEPEIQDKLQAVLKDWQGVFLDGKGTTALSVIKMSNERNNGIQYRNKTLTTRKSSCVNARGIPTEPYQVLHLDLPGVRPIWTCAPTPVWTWPGHTPSHSWTWSGPARGYPPC